MAASVSGVQRRDVVSGVIDNYNRDDFVYAPCQRETTLQCTMSSLISWAHKQNDPCHPYSMTRNPFHIGIMSS